MLKFQKGFTLAETLIVIAIVAVLASIAVPSFRNSMQDNSITAQSNDLASSLGYARTEAVKLGAPVTVCGSVDGATCDADGWNQNWLIFRDEDTPGVIDGGDVVLRLQEQTETGSSISVDGYEYIQFLGTGLLNLSYNKKYFDLLEYQHSPKKTYALGVIYA